MENHWTAQARKVAATLQAKHACSRDNAHAFERALANGADLRFADAGGSIFDAVVASGASDCLKLLLPHFNALSGPEASRIQEIANGAATGSIPGFIGNMGFSSAPMVAAMAKIAQAEIDRQTAQKPMFEALAIDSAAREPAPRTQRSRQGL